uniref:Cytochrome c oxidase subunit 2 n=1 Tax=Bilobella aurantiaca TaxID=106915 RepID=B5KMC2_BILAU|nr:cytochrome c oxidase subunit II [Bilobella aurantiaca]ABS88965.1 cytochrome c oxidase subunit II [Bilobella aurantiaca]
MPSISSFTFQNASSPLMEELIFFHDHTMLIIIVITTVVLLNVLTSTTSITFNSSLIESHNLEIFWTISPTFILILIGVPSIHLLYMLDEVLSPSITIKILGHQWYWSYEYTDFSNVQFDSFISYSLPQNARLLDVDNFMSIPLNTQIRLLISSSDVLHSWALPSFGVKSDAIPGRLNQSSFSSNRPGLFFGQCSEICGSNHSFMPIAVESLNFNSFKKWIMNFSS